MKQILQIILLLLTIESVPAQTFNQNLANKLQYTLDSLVTLFSGNTKGISASVYCPGQGVWQGVSGISHAGTPLTTDMPLGLASNTKLFTAVTMLKLAEDNIISLNDSLSDWIPNYANINPNITIRQLLNHSSGISDPFFTTGLLDTIKKYPTRVYTPQLVLAEVGAPTFNPGAGYGYSNINYILAGMVAQSATGLPISQLIRNYILTPLQLDSTFYDIEEAEIGTIAHRWSNNVDWHDTSRISVNTAGGPAGSLFSTAGDMTKWYHELMNNQFLTAGSFAELTNFGTPGNYGLGLQKATFFGNTTWGHGGSTIGYKTRVIHDPCMQTTVCGLANHDLAAVDGITALLYKVLVDYLPACIGAVTGTTTVCQGENSITYTVPAIVNATSYTWTLPNGVIGTSSTNSITVDYSLVAVSGDITVKGTNLYGESAISTLAVTVIPSPTPIVTVDINNNLESDAATGNQWYDQDGIIVGATNQTYFPFANGNYYVIVTQAGCVSDTSNVINIIWGSTDKLNPARQINIFPNPVKTELILESANKSEKISIEILNAIGQVVYTGSLVDRLVVSTTDFVSGVYFIKIENGRGVDFEKVVKE
jgi:D-alanyl-D-alanine carboxypeptidase